MTRAFMLPLASAACALFLAACTGPILLVHGSIEPLSPTVITASQFEFLPWCADGGSAIAVVERDAIAVEKTGEDLDSLAVTRIAFADTLMRVWSTPLPTPAALTKRTFDQPVVPDAGLAPDGVEIFHHAFIRSHEFVLISSVRDDEVLYLLARQFEVSTGAPLSSVVIDSVSVADIGDPDQRRFHTALSPDSLKVAAWHVNPAENERYDVSLTRLDGSAMASTTIDASGAGFTPLILPTNDGTLFCAFALDAESLVVIRRARDGDTVMRRMMFQTPSDPRVVGLTGLQGLVEDSGTIALALLGTVDDDLAAVQLVRAGLDGELSAASPAYLDEATTQSLIEEDELEYVAMDPILVSTQGAVRYIVPLEARQKLKGSPPAGTFGGSRPIFDVDELVILAFGQNGGLLWQKGIVKGSRSILGKCFEYQVSSYRILSDVLEVLSTTGGAKVLHRFRLTDGSPLTPREGVGLFESSGPLIEYARSLQWNGPSSYVAARRKGSGFEIMEVRYGPSR